ncbi:HECT-domain ubiquitin-transferase [Nitzschia inconspicua]|uniref:HECT-domain ubiquitin-transferase n=1 Tax=Nitzschia inconspicua TaxID=303405 RepID=A0A9K3LTL4_9STRA|nr:HECT-domain ubiquitin-transferase [Nitzschia inconspicua]KAG7367882.1 HECT-domain ubiquitin-transferase [Nitzschia inconspicua]
MSSRITETTATNGVTLRRTSNSRASNPTTTTNNNNNNNNYSSESSYITESSFTAIRPTRTGAYLTSNEVTQGDPNFFQLQVPPLTDPGTTFEFTISGIATNTPNRRYSTRCPPDCRPGNVLQVALLPEPKTMYRPLGRASLTSSLLSTDQSVGGAKPMKANIKMQNEKLLCNGTSLLQVEENETMEESTSLIVTVPESVREGMQFVVVTREQKRFLVECPNNVKPGSKIRVLLPITNPNYGSNGALHSSTTSNRNPPRTLLTKSSGQQQFKLFDIVVPPGALPNQLLPVNVYGKRVPVRLPSSVVEGETITLKVPLADVIEDLELDYEQVDTSLTGGWNRTIRMEDFKFQWVNSKLQEHINGTSSRSNSTRSASTEIRNAIRDVAFVRNLIKLASNDPRLPTAVVELIPPSHVVTESEFRLHPLSKPLVTYATTAFYIQSRSSLDIKQEWLYHNVFDPIKQFASQDGSKVRLLVRRSSLLADSVHCVMSLSPREMCRPWQIEFIGEPALDFGGVMREWMQLITEQIFDPNLGLWLPCVNNQVQMRINPACHVSCPEDYLILFRFLGRIVGRALLDRQVIHGHMVRHLYKHLLAWPVTFGDLEEQDKEYYDNLKQFTEMDPQALADLCLDFTISEDVLGQRTTFDLVPDGSHREVTVDNLTEYLEAILRYRMLESDKLPIQELLLGFLDVVPEACLTVFDPNELELMLCGLPVIDVSDWQAHTVLTGNIQDEPDACIVEWFWQIVRDDFDQEMKARLLQFTTGTSGVPSRGFSNLLGNDGNIQLFTIHGVTPSQCPYPRSHTCFNRIDLPKYKTKQELYEKLKAAITTSAVGFGIE